INWERYVNSVEPKVSKWMQKAKDQGLIQHICTSFHDSNENLIKLINTGYVESITLQYNMLDQKLTEGIALAHERGIGVVVMGPVAGGRLAKPSDSISAMTGTDSVPETALRFVLGNPDVSCALSGMSTLAMLEENARVAAGDLSLYSEDYGRIREISDSRRKLLELYCTGCAYCMPCPKRINIPEIFSIYNQDRVYGLKDHARRAYKGLIDPEKKRSAPPADCSDCGKCEDRCPQNIRVREKLKEAHQMLTEEPAK
ncbi:MAG TPA: aldo/keto reductase, partial [Clostridiales bacterium]|nr:aldo/keto reductase [Clostridiales bacterium]